MGLKFASLIVTSNQKNTEQKIQRKKQKIQSKKLKYFIREKSCSIQKDRRQRKKEEKTTEQPENR